MKLATRTRLVLYAANEISSHLIALFLKDHQRFTFLESFLRFVLLLPDSILITSKEKSYLNMVNGLLYTPIYDF